MAMAKTALTEERLTIGPGCAARLDALDHRAGDRLAAKEGALEIDADDAVEIGRGEVEKVTALTRIAALLTSTSMSPKASGRRATSCATSSRFADVAADKAYLPNTPSPASALRGRPRRRHRRARRAPPPRGSGARSRSRCPRRAGNDRDLVLKEQKKPPSSDHTPARIVARVAGGPLGVSSARSPADLHRLMIDDPWFYAAAIPAMLRARPGQGRVRLGRAPLVVPILSLVISPVQAAGITLPILILSDIVALAHTGANGTGG